MSLFAMAPRTRADYEKKIITMRQKKKLTLRDVARLDEYERQLASMKIAGEPSQAKCAKQERSAISVSIASIALIATIIFSGCVSENSNLPTNVQQDTSSKQSVSETVVLDSTDDDSNDTGPIASSEIPSSESGKDSALIETQPDSSTESHTGEIAISETSDSKASESEYTGPAIESSSTITLSSIPAYSGEPYVAINENTPYFTTQDYTTVSYEFYSELDSFGRCGVCVASIGQDLMPTEERGSIGNVKPTGWHTVKYDNVDGKYLYNRCHLIGYQLSGENANTRNLITGTRYLNIQGMLPFENMVADYIKETGNHVLYRATPLFDGDNLLASGVLLEGFSVEDNGDGICFNVFCYNVQPNITINYANGDSSFSTAVQSEDTEQSKPTEAIEQTGETEQANESTTQATEATYILNTNTKKFHLPSCSSVNQMSEKNKQSYSGSRDDLISQGYDPCKRCNP